MVMTNNLKIGENTIKDLRNEDGTFKKGTQIGRMSKKGFTLIDLNKLIRKYEKTHDQTVLKHYVEQLFIDNNLLSKYIDKNVPTKTISELTGADGSPLTFIVEKSYKKVKEEKGEENG